MTDHSRRQGHGEEAASPKDSTASPKHWPKHGTREGTDYRIFRTRFDALTNPRNGETMERVVLETPDWVNVVALDEEGSIVVIEQFRFGPGRNTIEIPGGMIDPGEDPLAAAKRELREETGYTSERWVSLGAVSPNPAFHDNLCHHFLSLDAKRTHDLDQDTGEDIVVRTMSQEELVRAIASGAIEHALVLTAVSRIFDLRWPEALGELGPRP